MRVVAYAITLVAAAAIAVLVVVGLVESCNTTTPCISCLLSRAVSVTPIVEKYHDLAIVGAVAIPASNIHVQENEILSSGSSKVLTTKPIVRINTPEVHMTETKPPCKVIRHVYETYRLTLTLKVVSHGWCGVTNIVKINVVLQTHNNVVIRCDLRIEKIRGYVKIRELSKDTARIYMEDCSCCDWDYRDEVYLVKLDLSKKLLVLHLVQAKGGFSHEVYVNNTRWFYKPGYRWISNINKQVPLKLVSRQIKYETVCS